MRRVKSIEEVYGGLSLCLYQYNKTRKFDLKKLEITAG